MYICMYVLHDFIMYCMFSSISLTGTETPKKIKYLRIIFEKYYFVHLMQITCTSVMHRGLI